MLDRSPSVSIAVRELEAWGELNYTFLSNLRSTVNSNPGAFNLCDIGQVFSRIEGSHFHKLITLLDEQREKLNKEATLVEMVKACKVFIVQHNWLETFRHATDFWPAKHNDFKLPFEYCCFEFKIFNKRVMYLIKEFTDGFGWIDTMAEVSNGYVSLKTVENYPELHIADGMTLTKHINSCCSAHVRAICIALDARVAVTEISKVPEKLRKARERRGKPPMNDFHIVNLAHRHRYAPNNTPLTDDHEKQKRRLHFRRGHWRHYELHKVWIKWQLVGNPDLGFVNTNYRL